MSIFSVCGVAVCGVFLCMMLRRENPEFAMLVSLGCGVIILISLVAEIGEVINFCRHLSQSAGLTDMYCSILLKALAVAYVTHFAADICRDSGQGGVAGKVELAGKIVILVMALPLMNEIIDSVLKMVNKGT